MKKNILYIVVLFGFSCNTDNRSVEIIQYFDTEVFVNNEIKELSKKTIRATKEISLNGEKEIVVDIEVDSAFLYREFKLLRDANINKSALLGKYQLDTFWFIDPINLEDHIGLEYSIAKEDMSKLKTKSITIFTDDFKKMDTSLSINMKSNNFMHSYVKYCRYHKDKYILIEAWEKTLFQDTIFYETKLIFELE